MQEELNKMPYIKGSKHSVNGSIGSGRNSLGYPVNQVLKFLCASALPGGLIAAQISGGRQLPKRV